MNTSYEKKQPVVKNGKPSKKKVKYTTHREERDSFIKKFGENEFERISSIDPKWKEYKDIPIPAVFRWLFKHFLNMWHHVEYDFNGNVKFTPRTILDYEECLEVDFTCREKQTLLAMKDWTSSAIAAVREKEDLED